MERDPVILVKICGSTIYFPAFLLLIAVWFTGKYMLAHMPEEFIYSYLFMLNCIFKLS